ncbi:MAG: heavy-metal-associated domain-containing protein [Planctomycetes bacterium]|nr:heavy-metal-associated domain-containing protein [Planctomycetota bacterium]
MKAVSKTVSSLEGVDKVEIDYETKTATITMKDGKTLTKDDLEKAFDGTKFGVESFETVKTDSKEDSKKEEPPKKDDSEEGKKK